MFLVKFGLKLNSNSSKFTLNALYTIKRVILITKKKFSRLTNYFSLRSSAHFFVISPFAV